MVSVTFRASATSFRVVAFLFLQELYMNEKKLIMITGFIGLLAAVLVGVGEFLLHYDPLARFSEEGGDYSFMMAATDARQTMGHFFGVLAAPLYVVGCWHIYLMLKPANKTLAFIAFVVGAYGFMIGADWISSRASIGAIAHLENTALQPLVDLYVHRYESLLTIIRITTLLLSIIIAYLAWTKRSHYTRVVTFLNPIVLLLFSFIVYVIAPSIGKYMMPIALNIGFGLFFILSLYQASKLELK